jgi:hypothetical protein
MAQSHRAVRLEGDVFYSLNLARPNNTLRCVVKKLSGKSVPECG